MLTENDLRNQLIAIDGRNYKAYRDLRGAYQFPAYRLWVDYIQGDPFAAPSCVRLQISPCVAQFPQFLLATPTRQIALADYLLRQINQACQAIAKRRGSGKSGLIAATNVEQSVLKRTAVSVGSEGVEVRLQLGLPASGRKILGDQALAMFTEDLPEIVRLSLQYRNLEAETITTHVETAEDAQWLRQQLSKQGLVAFVPNGAILPRRSGIEAQPLKQGAIAFQSPPSLEVSFTCPNRGRVTGMGIPTGITMIVGGGYHGKSTLLRAIAQGVYNYVLGDGRELLVTESTAMKIRAEDGRSVVGVNISPLIKQLPYGVSTAKFTTNNASGSTSQGANLIEALEVGSKLLLLDEDTTATNLMVRDRRMQSLIAKEQEPITPLLDKIRPLYQDYQVSSILVMGGCGDYLDVADTVIGMVDFSPVDLTNQARSIVTMYPSQRKFEGEAEFGKIGERSIVGTSINLQYRGKKVKCLAKGTEKLILGSDSVDMTQVEQLVEANQLTAIMWAIAYAKEKYLSQPLPLTTLIELVEADVNSHGLDILTKSPQGNLAAFRPLEFAAAINRLRSLQTF